MLRWMVPSVLVLALIVAAWPAAIHADEPPTVREVASELISQCGSGQVLADHDCGVARSMKEAIQRQIDDGASKQEILDSFVSIYGEQVLATPRKSGFGLMAWVTPFAVVAVGAAVGAALVWLWARRQSAPPAAAVPAGRSEDLDLYEERVDEDLGLLE